MPSCQWGLFINSIAVSVHSSSLIKGKIMSAITGIKHPYMVHKWSIIWPQILKTFCHLIFFFFGVIILNPQKHFNYFKNILLYFYYFLDYSLSYNIFVFFIWIVHDEIFFVNKVFWLNGNDDDSRQVSIFAQP